MAIFSVSIGYSLELYRYYIYHSQRRLMFAGVQLKFGFIKCFKCDFYIYHSDVLDRIQCNLMPTFSLHTLRMKFQKLVEIMKDAQEHPERQYVHSHCTVGKTNDMS